MINSLIDESSNPTNRILVRLSYFRNLLLLFLLKKLILHNLPIDLLLNH